MTGSFFVLFYGENEKKRHRFVYKSHTLLFNDG